MGCRSTTTLQPRPVARFCVDLGQEALTRGTPHFCLFTD